MKKIKAMKEMKKTYLSQRFIQSFEFVGLINLNNLEEIEPNIYLDRSDNSKKVHTTGGILAVAVQLDRGRYLIYTDKYFNMLPKMVQDFIIYHEIGHVKRNHYNHDIESNNNKNRFDVVLKRKLNLEIEADQFSASAIGVENAILSLEFIKSNIDLSISSKIEFQKRIKALR